MKSSMLTPAWRRAL